MKFEKGDIVLKTKTGEGRAIVVPAGSELERRILRSIRDALGDETTQAIHKHSFIFVRDKIVHFADQNGRVQIRTGLGFDPKKPATMSRVKGRMLTVEGDADAVARVVDKLAGTKAPAPISTSDTAEPVRTRIEAAPFFDADEAVSPRSRPCLKNVEVDVDPYSIAMIVEELGLSYNLGRALEHLVLGRASHPARRNHYRKAIELIASEIDIARPMLVRRAVRDIEGLRTAIDSLSTEGNALREEGAKLKAELGILKAEDAARKLSEVMAIDMDNAIMKAAREHGAKKRRSKKAPARKKRTKR